MKKSKFYFSFLFMAIISMMVIVGCQPKAGGESSTTQAEETVLEEGWIVMFDGTSTDGWRSYGKETFPESGWIIEDGALKCLGSGHGEAGGSGGDIIFDQKFKDFHFKMEWKISVGGNSGIFYLAQELEGEPIWKSSPEMQILDNLKHIDANLGKDGNRQAGSLYDLIPAVPQNAVAPGEWNEIEIMVYQGTVIHKQNGEVVLEYHLATPDWDAMIANSKFKEFPEFGKYKEGFIGLQDHGNDVWFRNMTIRDLGIE